MCGTSENIRFCCCCSLRTAIDGSFFSLRLVLFNFLRTYSSRANSRTKKSSSNTTKKKKIQPKAKYRSDFQTMANLLVIFICFSLSLWHQLVINNHQCRRTVMWIPKTDNFLSRVMPVSEYTRYATDSRSIVSAIIFTWIKNRRKQKNHRFL